MLFSSFLTPPAASLKGEKEDKLSAFLVERGFEGTIEAQPPLERIGLRGLDRRFILFICLYAHLSADPPIFAFSSR